MGHPGDTLGHLPGLPALPACLTCLTACLPACLPGLSACLSVLPAGLPVWPARPACLTAWFVSLPACKPGHPLGSLGPVLRAPLGHSRGSLGALFELSWALYWACRGPALGTPWDSLGALLELLGPSERQGRWPLLALSQLGKVWGNLGAVLGAFGEPLGGIWSRLELLMGPPGASSGPS